jgi:hypothetical protein
MTSGLTTAAATTALNLETPTKETPKTADMHVEKRLKRLWVRIGDTLKRLVASCGAVSGIWPTLVWCPLRGPVLNFSPQKSCGTAC